MMRTEAPNDFVGRFLSNFARTIPLLPEYALSVS
jgi:hypothetical protein